MSLKIHVKLDLHYYRELIYNISHLGITNKAFNSAQFVYGNERTGLALASTFNSLNKQTILGNTILTF